MTILFVVVAVAVIAVAAVVASGKLGQLADPVSDRQPAHIPPAPLAASQVVDLKFGTAVRGYRMQDVDEALGQLAETLRIREAQLSAMSSGAQSAQMGTEPRTSSHDQPNAQTEENQQ